MGVDSCARVECHRHVLLILRRARREYYPRPTLSRTNIPQGGLQKRGKELYEERERVYEPLNDGTIRWMAFKQKAASTLTRNGLPEMVIAVGGDPLGFRTDDQMAKYILEREKSWGVVREIDAWEMHSINQYVEYSQPLATEWFAGTYRDGKLVLDPSSEDVVLQIDETT